MKTPEEIKHGLERCTKEMKCLGPQCEYYGDFPVCIISLLRDAMEYISELEARAQEVDKRKREAAEKLGIKPVGGGEDADGA